MRSASLDRRRKEPQPRLPSQPIPLVGPQTVQHQNELLKLHTRLKTVVGKLMDFVTITSELLTSQRLPDSSINTQRRLLDELEQDKGRWEQYMFYSLSVQEDVLKAVPQFRFPDISLGATPSDFKKLTDLVAEAQNKVTVALRRKRDDSGLNSKVWEIFTTLTQRIYEAFFRTSESRISNTDAIKRLEEEADRLRSKTRDLELQLVETSGQLKSKDLELESIQRLSGYRTNTMLNSTLEADLQRLREKNSALQAENEHLRLDLETSQRRLSQTSSYKTLKRELDRKSANIDEYLTQSRPLAMSELELSRLKSDYELALHEVQQLREWKKRRENEEDGREDLHRSGRVVRKNIEENEDLKVVLAREREKSATFFSQLQKKEKELAELGKKWAMSSAELEHLRGLEEDYQGKLRRQQEEVAKFLGLIKALEEDKERAYGLVQQHYQDKLRAEREASALRIQYSGASNSEEVVKQLRLTIEEKQKLSRNVTENKTQLTQLLEEIAGLKQENSTNSREKDAALMEINRLQDRIKTLEKATTVTKEWKQRQTQDRRAVQDYVSEVRMSLEQQYSESLARLDEAENRVNTLEATLDQLKDQLRHRDTRSDHLKTELSQTLNQCADLQSALKIKQEEISTLTNTVKKLKSERDALQLDSKKKEDKKEFVTSSLMMKEKQLKDAQAVIEALEQERDEAVTRLQGMTRDQQTLSQAFDSLQDFRAAAAQAEEESASLRLSVAHITQAKTQSESQVLLLTSKIQQLQAENEDKNRNLLNLEDKLRTQTADFEAKLRNAEKKSAVGRERQASLESKVEDLTGKLQFLTGKMQENEGKRADFSEENSNLRHELVKLREEKEGLEANLTAIHSESTKKERFLSELKSGIEREKQAKEQFSSQVQSLTQELQDTLSQLEAKTDQISQLEFTTTLNSEEISRLKDQINALTTKMEAGKRQNQDSEKRRREAEERGKAWEVENNRLKDEIRGKNEEIMELNEEIRGKDREIMMWKTEKSRVEEALAQAGSTTAHVQTLLQAIAEKEIALAAASSDLEHTKNAYSDLKTQYESQNSVLKQEKMTSERRKLKAGNRKVAMQETNQTLEQLQSRVQELETLIQQVTSHFSAKTTLNPEENLLNAILDAEENTKTREIEAKNREKALEMEIKRIKQENDEVKKRLKEEIAAKSGILGSKNDLEREIESLNMKLSANLLETQSQISDLNHQISLKTTENSDFQHQITDLQTQNSHLASLLQTSETSLKSLQNQLKSAEILSNEQKTELIRLENALENERNRGKMTVTETEQAVKNLQNLVERMEKEKNNLKFEVEKVNLELNREKENLEQEKLKFGEISEKCREMEGKNWEFEREIGRLNAELSEEKQNLEGERRKMKEINEKFREIQVKNSEFEREIGRLNAELSEEKQNLEEEGFKFKEISDKFREMQKKSAEFESESLRLNTELSTAKENIVKEQLKFKEINEKLREAQGKATENAREIGELRSELAGEKDRSGDLESQLQAYSAAQSTADTVTAQLAALRSQSHSQSSQITQLNTTLELQKQREKLLLETISELENRLNDSERGKNSLQMELMSLGKELTSIKEEAIETSQLLVQQEEAQTLQTQQIEQLEANYDQQKTENQLLKTEIESFNREISDKEQENRTLDRKNQVLKRENEGFRRDLDRIKGKLEEMMGNQEEIMGENVLSQLEMLEKRVTQLTISLNSPVLLQKLRNPSKTTANFDALKPEISNLFELTSENFDQKLGIITENLENKEDGLKRCFDRLKSAEKSIKLREKQLKSAFEATKSEKIALENELKFSKSRENELKLDLKASETRFSDLQKQHNDIFKSLWSGINSFHQFFSLKTSSESDLIGKRLSEYSNRLNELSRMVKDWEGSNVEELQQKLIEKDEEILRLRSLEEEQIPEEQVFIEKEDSPLEDENERLRVSLSQALLKKEELEAVNKQLQQVVLENERLRENLAQSQTANSQLQLSFRSQPKFPTTFELAESIDSISAFSENQLHTAQLKLDSLSTRMNRILQSVELLRNMNSGNRTTIKRTLAKYERFTNSRMAEIGDRLEELDVRVMRRVAAPESEVFGYAVNFADQLEAILTEKLEETEIRLDRLARTTENVINLQSEEIQRLRQDSQRMDSLGDVLDSPHPRHTAGCSIEDILGVGTEARVCKRTRFLGDVWCLTMVGEEQELYWWREEEYQQFDQQKETWPEIEEDALNQQIESLKAKLKRMSESEKENSAAVEQINLIQDLLEKEGYDIRRAPLVSIIQTLFVRPHSAAPIDPSSFEHEDITVLTDESGRHPASVPVMSGDEEMAPFVQTLQRLTSENDEQGKTIEDLTRQIEFYKQALNRMQSEPGRAPDRLASTVVNLLEMLPEQPSNIESVINVLFELMLLNKSQVEEVQQRRFNVAGKEDKKKEKSSSWLRRKKN